MHEVGAYEAKTHLSKLLKKVSKGERIAICHHGTPIAMLIPAGKSTSISPQEAVAAIRSFRKGRKLGGILLQTLKQEGRR